MLDALVERNFNMVSEHRSRVRILTAKFTSHFQLNIPRVGLYLLKESLNLRVRGSIKVLIE
jgi:hypothetical protein